MKKTFALEGLPCSGKSTFINRFRKEHPEFECVEELYIKVNKDDDPKDMRLKYANAEIDKFDKYFNLNKNIIFERSFFSTLAFSYAKNKSFNDNSDYEFNLNFIKQNINKVIIPEYIFIFDISARTSIKRGERLIRDDILSFWKNEIFLLSFTEFYSSTDISKFIKNRNVFFVDTGNHSRKETYQKVCNIIQDCLSA